VHLDDIYMNYKYPTELWDALEHKYTISKDDHLFYTCEQLFDFSINVVKSMVTQAHELQPLSGDIAGFGMSFTPCLREEFCH
jgi:hypothetical protein